VQVVGKDVFISVIENMVMLGYLARPLEQLDEMELGIAG
jgi:hypothetical protein